ncbi:MAG: hypothetical protein ACTHNU_05565 [Gaiellales bacterium]
MARRWQMRTWTKGTGATVEPAGADDRPLAAARPGGLTALPSKRPWAAGRPRPAARLPQQRISGGARRRHALGYLDPAAVERLEALESQLGGESSDDPTDLEQVAAASVPTG